jgi:hypothetical protein
MGCRAASKSLPTKSCIMWLGGRFIIQLGTVLATSALSDNLLLSPRFPKCSLLPIRQIGRIEGAESEQCPWPFRPLDASLRVARSYVRIGRVSRSSTSPSGATILVWAAISRYACIPTWRKSSRRWHEKGVKSDFALMMECIPSITRSLIRTSLVWSVRIIAAHCHSVGRSHNYN